MASVPTLPSLNQPHVGTALGGSLPARSGEAGPLNDPQLVADMKHEIRTLVQEIAQLASQDIAPEEFYAGFLPRVVTALAAVGGIVWTIGESGKLKLQYQVNHRTSGTDTTPQARTRHGLLLKKILGGSQAVLIPPGSGQDAADQPGNSTSHLLVVAPLIVEKEPVGIVEIFQRPGGGPTTQRGYLRFLVQMCDVACDYLKSRRLRQLAESQSLWRQLEELVKALYRSLDLQETAYAVVNEGRRMIGCDRVSLALLYGSRCRIEAVSGLDAIDRRAAEVQKLAKLAEAVLRTGEPLWSETRHDELPTQIQQPLSDYVDQSHSRLVAVLPLTRASRGESTENDHQEPLIGAIIVEQLRDARATDTLRTRAEVVAHHSAIALTNAREHSSVLLLPLWKALGRATWLVRGHTLPKTFLVLASAMAIIGALAIVPVDFEVAARGKLQPAERHEIFAPLDGVVASVPVQHGEIVEQGAILAELTNTDLDLALAALIGKQVTNQERLAAVQRALLDKRSNAARLTPMDENRLAGELLELRQEAQNIERELVLLREKQGQLTMKALQRGQVVTWKVRELLLARPVSRGQGLLTLANPDGPWELELYLPERRLKHVVGTRAPAPRVGVPLGGDDARSVPTTNNDVTFVLSSHPGQVFHGDVVEIEQVAEVRGDEGNTVLVRVAVDKDKLPPLHDQTTVTAKLNCGRTSVGYAWFCDLIETVQTKVLFWLPI